MLFAAKLIDTNTKLKNRKYYSFISPEAYNILKDYMDFRELHGEKIIGESWLIRDVWQKIDRSHGHSHRIGLAKYPRKIGSISIRNILYEAWQVQGIGTKLDPGVKNPFVGSRPFSQDIEDQKLFFGRNCESEKIISLIYSHKLVLVHAQSGAGKTSLFNAKIVPELQKRGLQVLPIARVGFGSNVTDKTPTNIQQDEKEPVSSSIDNLYLLNTFQSLAPNISDYSALKDQSLSEFLEMYFPHQVNQRGKDIPQIIIFDRFEELFNFFSDPTRWQQHQQDFFSNISDALEKDPLLRIVFVIREDYLDQMDPFVSILPEKLKPRPRLERIRYDQAIQAIKGPLEISNYDVPIYEIKQIVQDLIKI